MQWLLPHAVPTAEWPAARSVRWPICSLAWSTTVATARAAIARVCCTAWAAALVGLPCRDGGQCGVEGWLAGTRVITGSASCGGGGKGAEAGAGAGARGTAWGPEGLAAGGGPPAVAG